MEKKKNPAFDFEEKDKTENFTADDNGTNSNKPTEDDESVNSLDSLLYDSDDSNSYSSSEPDPFESFFAEYRQLMASNLAAVNESKAEEKKEDDTLHSIINDIQTTIGTPESPKPKTTKKKTVKKTSDTVKKASAETEWSSEITLEPAVYESLDEEILVSEVSEEVFEPEVDLLGKEFENEGNNTVDSETSDGNLQLSFFSDDKQVKEKDSDDTVEKAYNPDKPRIIDSVFDFLELFIFTLAAVIILTTFVFKHSVVEGDSMNSTLTDGDHLIVWSAFYTPERGDIIVFEDYSTALKKPVVKRVIGLPGDKVEIKDTSDGKMLIYVNDERLDEDYALYLPVLHGTSAGVWNIGEGELFVVGDNRYNSTDSRDFRVGPISTESVLGKVVLRFYPFADFTTFN